jgi:hypothetical protein
MNVITHAVVASRLFFWECKKGRVQENSRGTPRDARFLATAGTVYLPFPKLLGCDEKSTFRTHAPSRAAVELPYSTFVTPRHRKLHIYQDITANPASIDRPPPITTNLEYMTHTPLPQVLFAQRRGAITPEVILHLLRMI